MVGKALLMLVLAQPAASASTATSPPPEELAPGVALLRGAILPERGPDGNTVVFDAPDGLVVVDTGRHAWHSDAILAYAKERGRPIATIVNTHWHLDHTSGNGRVKAAHPGARVYATDAVDRVLAPGGFLARNRESAKPMLEDPKLSETQKEEVKIFLATMDERDVLRPDVVVGEGGETTLAGKSLDLKLTKGAVTDADIWIYDASSRIAVVGDLVTFPAPFFETACPAAWRKALDDVWAVPFTIAVPGHGEPMSRDQFDAYRAAFNSFMECVEGAAEPRACAAAWTDGISRFTGDDEQARKAAAGYAEYYVGMLRTNDGRSPDCLAR
jgi:glyoxylase-like metal-dependent hydrolase (beta-lactamase superfamily II)